MRHILFFIIVSSWIQAFPQKWEVGLGAGTTGYMGDLNPNNPFLFKNLGGSLSVKRNLDPTWGIRANASFLPISWTEGDLTPSPFNPKFHNNVLELSILGEFHFFKFIGGGDYNPYTPYIFAGIAGIHHNPYVHIADEKINLMDLEINGDREGNAIKNNNYALSIPFGVGFKYNIKGPLTLGLELTYRTAFNNHLDAIGGYYKFQPIDGTKESNTMLKNYLSNSFDPTQTLDKTLRGTGNKNDGYMSGFITLTYTFISQNCYWW